MERSEIKQRLKSFEAEFRLLNYRNPTKIEISSNLEIAALYKTYNKLKSIPPLLTTSISTTTTLIEPRIVLPPPPVDALAWQRVFNKTESTLELEQLGPSPVKLNRKPFIPLFAPIASTSNTITGTTLFSKFTSTLSTEETTSTSTSLKSTVINSHPTLAPIKSLQRTSDDPTPIAFEVNLAVKAPLQPLKQKKGKWEISDNEDDDTSMPTNGEEGKTNVKGKGAKGKGKAKAIASTTTTVKKRSAGVGRGGKGYKKHKLSDSTASTTTFGQLGVAQESSLGMKRIQRIDKNGKLVLELVLESIEDDDDHSEMLEGQEDDDEMNDEMVKIKKKAEKIIIHQRRPYHRDSVLPTSTTTINKDDGSDNKMMMESEEYNGEGEEENIKSTLFYQDNYDLLASTNVFQSVVERARQTRKDDYDSDDEESPLSQTPKKNGFASARNLSPIKSHSIDPTLISILSLRSSPSKSSSAREKLRDQRIKKLLMEPLERERHDKPVKGIEEFSVLELRTRGLGTRLGENEEGDEREEDDENDDDWDEEPEGWKDLGGELTMDGFDWDS